MVSPSKNVRLKRERLEKARAKRWLKPATIPKKKEKEQRSSIPVRQEGLPSNYQDFDERNRRYQLQRKARKKQEPVRKPNVGPPRKTWKVLSKSRKQALIREMRRGYEGNIKLLSKEFVSEVARIPVQRLRFQYQMVLESGEILGGEFEMTKEKKDYVFEKIRKKKREIEETEEEERVKEQKKEKRRQKGFQVLAEVAKSSVSKRVLQDILWASDGDLKNCFLQQLQKEIDEEMQEKLPSHSFEKGVDGQWVDPKQLVDLIFPSMVGKVHCPSWMVVVLSGDGRKSGKNHGVILTLKICVGNARGNYVSSVYPIAISRGTEKYQNLKMMFQSLREPLQVFFFFFFFLFFFFSFSFFFFFFSFKNGVSISPRTFAGFLFFFFFFFF